jgi:hypothetical protein
LVIFDPIVGFGIKSGRSPQNHSRVTKEWEESATALRPQRLVVNVADKVRPACGLKNTRPAAEVRDWEAITRPLKNGSRELHGFMPLYRIDSALVGRTDKDVEDMRRQISNALKKETAVPNSVIGAASRPH